MAINGLIEKFFLVASIRTFFDSRCVALLYLIKLISYFTYLIKAVYNINRLYPSIGLPAPCERANDEAFLASFGAFLCTFGESSL
jgi:hypothetical protein